MNPKLRQITSMSRSDPDTRFHSVFHLVINEEHLRDCFQRLPADKAVGIDGATKRAYGERLEENLRDLVDRLHRGSYRGGDSSVARGASV